MKIATFNMNNVKKRLPNLLDWMRESSPDVVCFQELKATDTEFPVAPIRSAGYETIWQGQKTWNGVAILSRTRPIETWETKARHGAGREWRPRHIPARVR
jgi:exodeoxyribonuclease-3